jgi:hypothetical protein
VRAMSEKNSQLSTECSSPSSYGMPGQELRNLSPVPGSEAEVERSAGQNEPKSGRRKRSTVPLEQRKRVKRA